MNVRIKKDDGTTVAYWGISDFSVGQDNIILFTPNGADYQKEILVDGEILSGVSNESMNRPGLMEAVGIDAERDDVVHLIDSNMFWFTWIPDDFEMPDGADIRIHEQ